MNYFTTPALQVENGFVFVILFIYLYIYLSIFTKAGLQVILDVGVKVATQAAGSAHKFWAELDVDRATASIPGQGEAELLRCQHVVRDLLQPQLVDVMGQLQAETRTERHELT